MRYDDYNNPIFDDTDILDLIYSNRSNKLSELIVDPSVDVDLLKSISEINITISSDIDYSKTPEEKDKDRQNTWFMPEEYKNMDIEGYLVHVCPKENYQRLIEELEVYRKKDMLSLLKWLKYFVDTCRSNNILWGVGRGSSVSSYVLFLIGIHKIDSIKYNLDWREFLR
jgi:DNA polymerase III alpha subunit